jgi:hypothetical protein
VISHTTVVHVHEINVYRNVGVRHGVTVIPRDRFGHGPVPRARATVDPSQFEPIRGKLDIAPARASLVPDRVRGVRPPEAALRRPVVATRAPEDPARWLKPQGIPEPAKTPAASARLVPTPPRAGGAESPPRPPFGASKIERPRSAPPPRPDRAQPPGPTPPARATAPRVQALASPPPAGATAPRVQTPPSSPPAGGQARPTPTVPRVEPGPTAPAPRAQAPPSRSRALPGEPANRLFPGRSPQTPARGAPPSVRAPSAASPAPAPRQQPRPAEPGR